jgi:hypothetical protein
LFPFTDVLHCGKCEDDALEDIATEAFLRGCKEKKAAIKAVEKNPVTLSKAIQACSL